MLGVRLIYLLNEVEKMLVNYKFENFMSFKDSNEFSMLGVRSFKEHEEDNLLNINNKKILRSSVIYGNNASGKSNFINSIAFMKYFVLNSFKNALSEESTIEPLFFLLNDDSVSQPSKFEVSFIFEKIDYKFGFELFSNSVVKEYLYYKPNKKEIYLYKRENSKIDINKTSFIEGIDLKSKTKDNVLFLSVVAQFNGDISTKVIEWFKNINIISGTNDIGFSSFTISRLQNDKKFNSWISRILQSLEIANISIAELDTKDIELIKNKDKIKNKAVQTIISALYDLSINKKHLQINLWHKKFRSNNVVSDCIPFDFNTQESEGTKRLVYLLGPWYDTLKYGKILIVDELDTRLHTLIVKFLIQFFHQLNINNAQLIFSSHDVNLLDKDFFRRDQIWFAEKNQFGISNLYSLSDFKALNVRNTSSFEKNYLFGKFGAISYLKINRSFAEDLFNE